MKESKKLRPAQTKQIDKLKSKLIKQKLQQPVKKEEVQWCITHLFWFIRLKVEKSSITQHFEYFVKHVAHGSSSHPRHCQLPGCHDYVKFCLPLAPRIIEVPAPERKELKPSSLALTYTYLFLTCSIMHSNRTKNPPKEANPLPVLIILRQSFRNTMAVDLLTLPTSISLISTAFMNMAMMSPIAPPIT